MDKDIIIRKFSPTDSIIELTELLHRGYRQLADKGLNFVATNQNYDITEKRLQKAECYVAELNSRLIATIAYYPPGKAKGCEWYEKPGIAKFGQFCVDPAYQKNGLGSELIGLAESLALKDRAVELSLDTAEPAQDLINYYTKRGYRFITHIQWGTTNYRSVILSKKLI